MTTWMLLALLVVFTTGCTVNPAKPNFLTWSVVKSEITGKCYDAASRYPGKQQGLLALGAEVPCPLK